MCALDETESRPTLVHMGHKKYHGPKVPHCISRLEQNDEMLVEILFRVCIGQKID